MNPYPPTDSYVLAQLMLMTERQTDRQANTQRERLTKKQRQTQAGKQTDRLTDSGSLWAVSVRDRQTDSQTVAVSGLCL